MNPLNLPGIGALPVGVLDVVDVAVTTILIYYFLLLIRGTRAVQIMVGLFVLVSILAAAKVLHLLLLATVMQYVVIAILVTLPIVFQPELRRALEQIGRGGFFAGLTADEGLRNQDAMTMLASAATALSQSRTGALIAIEQTTGLKEIIESGTRIDAVLSTELILTLFSRRTPLHDGAAIVGRGRVLAAACFLPLSESVTDRHLGTRHRAALGLSEQTDAVVLVISEQTGSISIARGGRLSREIADEERLRRVLLACTRPPRARRQAGANFFAKIRTRIPRATGLTEKLRT